MEQTSTYTPYTPQDVDLMQEAVTVIKTVLLLDRKYSAGYLSTILRADETFGLRKPAHKSIETYGALEDRSFGYVDNLIQYLLEAGLLRIEKPEYGSIEASEKGISFLTSPEPMVVSSERLRKPWYELDLIRALKQVRKTFADRHGKEPWRVFNNFTLAHIALQMPESETDLAQVPGIQQVPRECRLLILAEVSRIQEKKAQDERTGIYTKAYSSSYRKIKELFTAGLQVEEIASRRNAKPSFVIGALETLHQAGELNIRPWIEQFVDGKTLFRAAEYFRQARYAKLKEAHELLGYDYDTLRLCRVYAQSADEPAVPYAKAS
ncbi:MAG: RQC domain-containing protein [Bacteroidia bacterium]|nr:RQC domain-containing protein [Bacteroidia bacterium]